MPQFNSLFWINLLSYLFLILGVLVWYNGAISFTFILRQQLSRAIIAILIVILHFI